MNAAAASLNQERVLCLIPSPRFRSKLLNSTISHAPVAVSQMAAQGKIDEYPTIVISE